MWSCWFIHLLVKYKLYHSYVSFASISTLDFTKDTARDNVDVNFTIIEFENDEGIVFLSF